MKALTIVLIFAAQLLGCLGSKINVKKYEGKSQAKGIVYFLTKNEVFLKETIFAKFKKKGNSSSYTFQDSQSVIDLDIISYPDYSYGFEVYVDNSFFDSNIEFGLTTNDYGILTDGNLSLEDQSLNNLQAVAKSLPFKYFMGINNHGFAPSKDANSSAESVILVYNRTCDITETIEKLIKRNNKDSNKNSIVIKNKKSSKNKEDIKCILDLKDIKESLKSHDIEKESLDKLEQDLNKRTYTLIFPSKNLFQNKDKNDDLKQELKNELVYRIPWAGKVNIEQDGKLKYSDIIQISQFGTIAYFELQYQYFSKSKIETKFDPASGRLTSLKYLKSQSGALEKIDTSDIERTSKPSKIKQLTESVKELNELKEELKID